MAESNLILHCGAREVPRGELALVPTPVATSTWFPVGHATVIDTVERSLSDAGFEIRKSRFGLNLAVMLALSPKRNASNPAFLTRNCKRDARRIFLHRPHHETHFTDLDQGATAAATGIDDGTEFDPIENRLPNRRQPTPDEVAIANESETRVRTAVSGLPYGEECFEALLVGEPIADTAARLGVEPHTVARVRANIRVRASRVLV